MLKSFAFTVKDSEGREVHWRGTQLPGRRSYDLWKRLSVAIVPALGAAAKEVLGAMPAEGLTADFLRANVLSVAGQLDLARLGLSFGDMAKVLLSQDTDATLALALLAGCQRQDPESGRWEDANAALFDKVFGGNLRELITVLGHVAAENYRDFWPTSASAPSAVVDSAGMTAR